jgi:hypothetical protein
MSEKNIRKVINTDAPSISDFGIINEANLFSSFTNKYNNELKNNLKNCILQ